MKRVIALTGIITLLMPTITYATTSSVSVQNTIDTSSNSDTTSTSESHVRIETNGEVKEFNATGDEGVDWTSDDGKSSVKIINNGTSVQAQTSIEVTPSITPSPDASPSPTPQETPKTTGDNEAESKSDFVIPLTPISMVVTLVKSLFSLL